MMDNHGLPYLVMVNIFITRCLYKFLMGGSMKCFGVILQTFIKHFKTTHFILGSSFALQLSACNITSPLVKLFQRWTRYKTLFVIGGGLSSVGYFCQAFLPTIGIWQILLYCGITGMGFGLCNISSIVFMKRAFPKTFATAYSISLFSGYFGISLLPFLSEYLIRSFGIQVDMAVIGLLCLFLVPLGLILPSDEAQNKVNSITNILNREPVTKNVDRHCNDDDTSLITDDNHHDDSRDEETPLFNDIHRKDQREENDLESRQVYREWNKTDHNLFLSHPDVLLVLVVNCLYGYSWSSWCIYLVPFGESVGLSSSMAVLMSTYGGVGGIMGNIYSVSLFCINQANFITVFGVPCTIIALCFISAMTSASFGAMVVYSVLSGFGISVMGITTMSIAPSTVCDDHFEVVVVLMYFLSGLFGEIGGCVTGALIDYTGSFHIAFGLVSMLNLLIAVVSCIWWFVRRCSWQIG